MSDGYDSILVEAKLAANKKFRRLTPPERWCAVFGVWAIAAQSPVRGYLLITESEPANEDDYAAEANVTVAVARSTVKRMRDELGMIERDPEMGAEYVHDWDKHQPDPKPSDTKAAWRERKRREREAKREGVTSRPEHADVTRDVTANVTDSHAPLSKEKKREGKTPPNPPSSGGRKRDRESQERELSAWVGEHPVTDELEAVWDRIASELSKAIDDGETFRIYIAPLHLHADGEELVVGAPPQQAGWVEDRFGALIREAASKPVRFIDCGCVVTRERAA